ncbi:MAG: patatin-like phospholipase family protein [Methylocystis sp.]|nr:patatin-like phospholipase family protein [Methylocystis sp.]
MKADSAHARKRRRYRVLSFDGGGIRGIVAIILLQRLEKALPGWLNATDLYAGTSTGGIIALALARGLPLQDIRALYEQKGREVFDDSLFDNVFDLGNLAGAQYSNRRLATELKRIFGNLRLADLPKRVLVPAFRLDNEDPNPARRSWSPKFFHNFPGEDSDGEAAVYKVALYTSAAPTYFPSVDGFIDGGVCANNPSMAALAQTQDRRALPRPPPLGRIALMSVGTGTPLLRISRKTLDWGVAQWARPLVQILFDGMMGIADYQCRQLLGPRYYRLAPVFPPGKAIAMDEVNRLPELIAFAEGVDIAPAVEWLRREWML